MAVTDISSYDNLLKEKFGPTTSLLPSTDKLQKLIPFGKGNKVGKLYEENVDLEFEHGYTFTGNQAAPTLRGGQTAENENAQITPSGIVGQKVVGYRDFFRSEGAGENAFADASKKRVTDLVRGTRRNIEISMLHGQSANGIGVVSALSGQNITITAATWAPGIWSGAKNMPITVYQSNLTTIRQGSLFVTAVDTSGALPIITVTGTTTGIVAGDVIFRDTAILGTPGGVFQEMVGISKALRNTGTLWNIDGSVATGHMLWRSNTYAVGGRLTMGHILKATALAVPKGLTNGCIALIPTRAYEAMNEDQSALREYNGNTTAKEKLTNGVQSLSFIGQAGEITVVPHTYMMEGEAFILPFEADMDPEDRGVKRIGSTDVAFGLPGDPSSIVRHKDNQAAVEIRNFTDQALFLNCLGRCVLMTGLAYT